MTKTTYYSSIAAARNALAMDYGFDPFLHGGIGGFSRPTKATMADLGYPVDAKIAAAQDADEATEYARQLAASRAKYAREQQQRAKDQERERSIEAGRALAEQYCREHPDCGAVDVHWTDRSILLIHHGHIVAEVPA